MKRNNRGLSLLEVIVTIGIITLLIGLIYPAINSVKSHGRQTETKAEITQLDTALTAYFADNGYYPSPNQMLASLNDKYFNFKSSRIDGNIYKDPMGGIYLYLCPGVISAKGYDLASIGLLKAQGAFDTLGRLFAAAASSLYTTDGETQIRIGDPAGLAGEGGRSIWGLSQPTYDMIILSALSLLRSTDRGFILAQMINITNMPIIWDETLLDSGTLAYYWPYEIGRGIYVSPIFSGGPIEALAAIIAHEATHLADNLYSGDTDFDSIEEEYDAFYNGAMVWKELTEGKEFTNLNDPEFVEEHPTYVENIEFQEENLALMMEGEEEVKENLRKRYPQWPENDQYGDSYVVTKN